MTAPRIDDLLTRFGKPFTLTDYQRERAVLERRFLLTHGTHAEDIDSSPFSSRPHAWYHTCCAVSLAGSSRPRRPLPRGSRLRPDPRRSRIRTSVPSAGAGTRVTSLGRFRVLSFAAVRALPQNGFCRLNSE